MRRLPPNDMSWSGRSTSPRSLTSRQSYVGDRWYTSKFETCHDVSPAVGSSLGNATTADTRHWHGGFETLQYRSRIRYSLFGDYTVDHINSIVIYTSMLVFSSHAHSDRPQHPGQAMRYSDVSITLLIVSCG
jgi:hypothetical protein